MVARLRRLHFLVGALILAAVASVILYGLAIKRGADEKIGFARTAFACHEFVSAVESCQSWPSEALVRRYPEFASIECVGRGSGIRLVNFGADGIFGGRGRSRDHYCALKEIAGKRQCLCDILTDPN